MDRARVDANGIMVDAGDSSTVEGLISDAINAAYRGAQKFLDMAISAAKDAAASEVIDDMVTEYRKQALKTHLRSVNRFAGSMSDINAVQGSQFIIGMALKEAEYTSDVNKFQAELSMQTYLEAIRTFASSSTFLVTSFIQIFSQLLEGRLRVISESFSSDTGDLIRTIIAARMQAYGLDYSSEVEALGGHMNSRAQTLSYALSGQLNGSFQSKLAELSDSSKVTTELVSAYMGYNDRTMSMQNAYLQLLSELKRIKFVMKTEQFVKDLEYDVKSSQWDIELFQQAGNVISAYSGAVVPTAGKPSPGQSALGGALAGASLAVGAGASFGVAEGASVGALGGPMGIALGAGLGAATSLLLQ